MGIAFDLQDFILRARVLKLYRQALRTAKRAPSHSRGFSPYRWIKRSIFICFVI